MLHLAHACSRIRSLLSTSVTGSVGWAPLRVTKFQNNIMLDREVCVSHT